MRPALLRTHGVEARAERDRTCVSAATVWYYCRLLYTKLQLQDYVARQKILRVVIIIRKGKVTAFGGTMDREQARF